MRVTPARVPGDERTMLKLFLAARHIGRGLFNAVEELGSVRLAPPRDHRAAAHRLAGALGTIARAHDLVVTVRGEIPRSTALIVANHVSYLDPIALSSICPALLVAKQRGRSVARRRAVRRRARRPSSSSAPTRSPARRRCAGSTTSSPRARRC